MSSLVKLTWCQVWLMNLRVNDACIDIGRIRGLTPAEKSNPIGWVIELNSNGKVRQGFGWILHGILMLMQPWFSLAWVSIMVRLNFIFNKFRSSLVLKTGRAISLFPHFLFLNRHQVQEQVWGRSLGSFMHIHSRSPTTRAQHRMNQHVKGQDNWC